eukprot:759327-Hanusia_phi.AAC.13
MHINDAPVKCLSHFSSRILHQPRRKEGFARTSSNPGETSTSRRSPTSALSKGAQAVPALMTHLCRRVSEGDAVQGVQQVLDRLHDVVTDMHALIPQRTCTQSLTAKDRSPSETMTILLTCSASKHAAEEDLNLLESIGHGFPAEKSNILRNTSMANIT